MKDYLPDPENKTVLALSSLYGKHGYRQYKMSKFEEYDLYLRNKDFLVSDNIITFTDTSGKLMALKPDVTLSIVKNLKDVEDIEKVYYNENVYRISKGTRSFKEIMQTGLECIGNIDDYTIYEVIMLAAKSLESISENFVLDISHLGIIFAITDTMNISESVKKEIIRCIGDKNQSELTAICKKENIDGSAFEKMITSYGNTEDVKEILSMPVCGEFAAKLSRVFSALEANGFKNKVRIDFSVVNDINYYNGFVFKGFIEGIASGILSGGQYDKLMAKMGRSEKAIGFAVYLDMLEQLSDDAPEFDTDTVLLYKEGDDINAVSKAVSKLGANGESVIALKTVPRKIKYRRLIKLGEKEGENLE